MGGNIGRVARSLTLTFAGVVAGAPFFRSAILSFASCCKESRCSCPSSSFMCRRFEPDGWTDGVRPFDVRKGWTDGSGRSTFASPFGPPRTRNPPRSDPLKIRLPISKKTAKSKKTVRKIRPMRPIYPETAETLIGIRLPARHLRKGLLAGPDEG